MKRICDNLRDFADSEFGKALLGIAVISTLFTSCNLLLGVDVGQQWRDMPGEVIRERDPLTPFRQQQENKTPVVVPDKESLAKYVDESAKNLCTYFDTGLANPEIWVRSRINEADEFLVNSDKYRDGQHNFTLRIIGAIGAKAATETCPKYRTPIGRALIGAIDCKKGVCRVIEPD